MPPPSAHAARATEHRAALLLLVLVLAASLLVPAGVAPAEAAAPPVIGPPPPCMPTTSSHDTDGAPGASPHTFCWEDSSDGLTVGVSGTLGRGTTATVTASGNFADPPRIDHPQQISGSSACARPDSSRPEGWFVVDCRNLVGDGGALGPADGESCDDKTSCTLLSAGRVQQDNVWTFMRVGANLGSGENLRRAVAEAPVRLIPEAGPSAPLAINDATQDGTSLTLDATRSMGRFRGPDLVSHEWTVRDGDGPGDPVIATLSGPLIQWEAPSAGPFYVTVFVADADGLGDSASKVPEGPVANPDAAPFTWEVRQRLEQPQAGQIPDLADTPEEIQHTSYPVDFEITDVARCQESVEWLVNGQPMNASSPDTCRWTIDFPDEGERTVALRLGGQDVHEELIDVQDHLILVLGDSVASGEGNPDATTIDARGATIGQWADEPCHRSMNSGHARAALRMELDDPESSVTLVHLACSGARIAEGLTGEQSLADDAKAPAQLTRAAELIGEREVDAALVSIGANDLQFADIALFCSANGFIQEENILIDEEFYLPCYQTYMSLTSRANVNVFGLQFQSDELPIPEALTYTVTRLCVAGDAGDRRIIVEQGADVSDQYIATLNALKANYSNREPAGPAGKSDFNVKGTPVGGGCPLNQGSTNSTVLPMANIFLQGAGLGLKVDLDGSLAEDHPLFYIPVDDEGEFGAFPTERSREVVFLTPEFTLEEVLAEQLFPDLQAKLAGLGPALAAVVPADRTFITEYPDPLTDAEGGPCQQVLTAFGDPDSGIDAIESGWARLAVLGRLNTALASAAGDHGWKYVGGPGTDYLTHGMCSTAQPWFHNVQSSFQAGSGYQGILHPNSAGHANLTETFRAAIVDGTLRPATAYDDPPEIDEEVEIEELLEAGGNQVTVDADADIDDGDVVVLSPDADTDADADPTADDDADAVVDSAPEIRRVVSTQRAITRGGEATKVLTLDAPVEHDHLPGMRIVVLDHLDAPPEPLDLEQRASVRLPRAERARLLATSVQISQTRFADPEDRPAAHAVVARIDGFADALAGSALTGEAPLLLTDRDALPEAVADELQRVLQAADTVYVLGGEAAVSAAVAEEITALGFTVTRLSGATRIETALAVADEVVGDGAVPDVLLVRATSPSTNPTAAWADSVAGGGWAADNAAPVLLTPTGSLHPAVAAWLAARAPERITALGGEAALSPAAVDGLTGVTRIFGDSREDTAVAISQQLWTDQPGYVLVNGFSEDGWAYGLAAAGLAADLGRPLLLSRSTSLPAATDAVVGECPPLAVIGDVVAPACFSPDEPDDQ